MIRLFALRVFVIVASVAALASIEGLLGGGPR